MEEALGSGGTRSLGSREDWEQTEMKTEKKDTDWLERDSHVQPCSGKQRCPGRPECQQALQSHAENGTAVDGGKWVPPLPHRVWREAGLWQRDFEGISLSLQSFKCPRAWPGLLANSVPWCYP